LAGREWALLVRVPWAVLEMRAVLKESVGQLPPVLLLEQLKEGRLLLKPPPSSKLGGWNPSGLTWVEETDSGGVLHVYLCAALRCYSVSLVEKTHAERRDYGANEDGRRLRRSRRTFQHPRAG